MPRRSDSHRHHARPRGGAGRGRRRAGSGADGRQRRAGAGRRGRAGREGPDPRRAGGDEDGTPAARAHRRARHGADPDPGRTGPRPPNPDRDHPGGFMIELWHCKDSRSLRALWTLEELGLDYRLHLLHFPPRLTDPGYTAINPLGTVPYLTDGDTRMTESSAIAHYLARRYGEGGWPSRPRIRPMATG